MTRAHGHRVEVFLHPGEYCVGTPGTVIWTLLGSCVSITLWHPASRIGAMSHFLLSTRVRTPQGELNGRYGDEALALMLRDLKRLGVAPHECQAGIFGGASMFHRSIHLPGADVGRRNGEAARAGLRDQGVRVVSESLFGKGHRKIRFDLATGRVWSHQATLPEDLEETT